MRIERMSAPALCGLVKSLMEPKRQSRLKQFRTTTAVIMGWKLTSSTGKMGHLETITRLRIPIGTSIYVGDTDGYANQSFLYRQFRADQAEVVENRFIHRPPLPEIYKLRASGGAFDIAEDALSKPHYDVDCTLSIHDPTFEYRRGSTVVPRGRDFSYDEGYFGPGIHFFIDFYDAYAFT